MSEEKDWMKVGEERKGSGEESRKRRVHAKREENRGV